MLRGHSCVKTAAAPPIPLLITALLAAFALSVRAGELPAMSAADYLIARHDTLTVTDTLLQLGSRFVSPVGVELYCNGTRIPDSVFTLDPAPGIIRFQALPSCSTLVAVYRAWPFRFPLSASLREPRAAAPSTDSVATAAPPEDSRARSERPFGGADAAEGFRLVGFDIQGAKSVSVSGGGATGGTLVDQNLMLEIAGKLSADTRLSLRLNDQDLPLSPEGRSAELRELDEISVRLTSPRGNVSLGDYDFRLDGFRYARVERKLDGVAGEYNLPAGSVAASAALSGGTYRSLRFNAREGSQGPYQLTARDGSPVRVLAGTERVYLDGRLLIRGLRADYTIDYNLGTLYFTERNLLGSESRIEVDYEYTSLSFKRSFYSLTGGADSRFGRVRGYFIRESDLESSPLGEDFTREEREYLESLGVSADSLELSGVRYLGPGKGSYLMRGESASAAWFEFVGALRGDYMVTFRDVGDFRGSYVFDSASGGYSYVGEGLGNFEPIGRFAPPQRQDRAGAAFEITPLPHLNIEGEVAVLNRAVNLFSGASLPAAFARNLGLRLDTLPLPALPLKLSLRGGESRVERGFSFQGRRHGPDFERLWHLAPLPEGEETPVEAAEDQRESSVRLDLPGPLSVSAGYGELSRGNGERADRREYGLDVRPGVWPFEAAWRRLNVHSQRLADTATAGAATPLSGYRRRDNLSARTALGRFTPRLELEREELTGVSESHPGEIGHSHIELRPRLSARLSQRFETSLSLFHRGNEYLHDGGGTVPPRWLNESTVRAAETDFRYQGSGAFRLSGRLGHRTRRFERDIQSRAASTAGRVEMFAGNFSGALQSHLLYEISHGSSLRSTVRFLPERHPEEGEYLADGTWVGRAQGTHRRETVIGGIDPVSAAGLNLTSRENLDLTAWIDTAATRIRRLSLGNTVQIERENNAVESWKLYALFPSALGDKDGAVMRATRINTDLTIQWADPGIHSRLELLWNSRFDRRFESGYEEFLERLLRLQLRVPLAEGLQWEPTPAWGRRGRTNLNGAGRTVRTISLENRLSWDISRDWRLNGELETSRHRVPEPRAAYSRFGVGGSLARFLGGSGRAEAGGRLWRVMGGDGRDVLLVDVLGLAGSGTGFEVTAAVSAEPAERMLLHVRYTGRTDYLRDSFTNYGRAEIKYIF